MAPRCWVFLLMIAPAARADVKTTGLFQGWFVARRAGDTSTTFRPRRAEIQLAGAVAPFGFTVKFDAVRLLESPTTLVQDLLITWTTPYADVSLGQFKIPVSWEGYNSSARLLFPERSLVSRTFGDRRDVGVRAVKAFERWSYSAGVFNGAGQNRLDDNNAKDATLRLEIYPVPGLTLAAVAYDQIGLRSARGTKDRWEADARYERGPLLVHGELIRARDVGTEGARHSAGAVIAAAWLFGNGLQPAVRVGRIDPRLGHEDHREVWQIEAGVSWLLAGHGAKLQASVGRLQFDDAPPETEATFAAQVAY